jgi:diacylglycerol kinase (ATP)
MDSKKKILFIINPISGTGKQKVVERLVSEHLDHNKYESSIKYTESAGHAIKLSAEASKDQHDIVVAVGGDGSVNEAGQSLVNTDTILAVIPTGSGNGLARHLNIPLNLKDAILLLNTSSFNRIDVGMMNDKVFLGTAGVGFDAYIGKLFDEAKSRGFLTYVKLSIKEFFKYKSQDYEIEVDGKLIKRNAFIVCFGNSNQWGNNVFISPNSIIDDGFLRVIIIKKISLLFLPFFIVKLFRKKVNTSMYYEEFKGKKIKLKQQSDLAHLDGDPIVVGNTLTVEVVPNSLNILYKS